MDVSYINVVGNKDNYINISKIKFDTYDYVQSEIIYRIQMENISTIHSCLSYKDCIYMIDSHNSICLKYSIFNDTMEECFTGKDPRHLCISNNKLYITNFESNSVSIIDVDSFQLESTIQVGLKPHDVVIHKDNMYITCYDENEIYIYDMKQVKKGCIELKGKPLHAKICGEYLYAISYYMNSENYSLIDIINLETNKIERTITIKGITDNFVVDDENKRLLVISIENQSLCVISLKNDNKKQIHFDGYLEDVSVDNQFIYVINSDERMVEIIDKNTLIEINQLKCNFVPRHIITHSLDYQVNQK